LKDQLAEAVLSEAENVPGSVGSQHPVRILIADTSGNLTGRLESLLRSAGIATRMETTTSLDSINGQLAEGAFDLLFCATDIEGLAAAIPEYRSKAQDLPILLISSDRAPMAGADGLMIGATDVIGENSAEHLLLATRREINNACRAAELIHSRVALAEAEQRCQLLLSSSRAAIAYVHEGMHIHANGGYLELFGFEDPDDLLGLPLLDLIDDEQAEEIKGHLKTLRDGDQEITTRFVGHSLQGEPVTGDVTFAPAEYEGERCTQLIVRVQTGARKQPPTEVVLDFDPPTPASETSEPKASEPSVAAVAAVAAPVNPYGIALESFLQQTVPDSESDLLHGVVLAQIDNFDAMRGSHGLRAAHAASDQIATALFEAAAGSPVSAVDPSQYALAISGTSRDDLLHQLENLRSAIEVQLVEVGERTIRVTMSFAAILLDERVSPAEALDSAYIELTRMVQEGSNQISMPELPEARLHNDEAASALRRINNAIDNNDFTLLFQPIISLKGDAEEHYEVFLRMVDDEGKQIVPADFLQMAIDNGVANKIDRWVILQSIKMLSAHRADGHETRLSINVTSNSLTDPEFIDWLAVAIKAARMPSDAVIFQVAQPDASNYVRQTREFVEGLKAMHCRASLNRFSGDAQGFDLLQHIPVDLVKLEGSLVTSASINDHDRETLIEVITNLQEGGKLSVVPMVESAAVLSVLWQAGANYIQGYYLQEPTTDMSYDFTTDN
jgi:PAS domain S-box-containing protein